MEEKLHNVDGRGPTGRYHVLKEIRRRGLAVFLAVCLSASLPVSFAWADTNDSEPECPVATSSNADETAKAATSSNADQTEKLEKKQISRTATSSNAVEVIGKNGSSRKYSSIMEAAEAAEDGQTIRLISDIAETVYILEDKTLVFDLNGHKWTGGKGGALLAGAGNITVRDSKTSGMITNGSGLAAVYIVRDCTFVLESGKILAESPQKYRLAVAVATSGETNVTIKGGTIKTKSAFSMGFLMQGGSLIIQNGEFTGNDNSKFMILGEGKAEILNGTFKMHGFDSGDVFSVGPYMELEIKGGDFRIDAWSGSVVENYGNTKILGGSFRCGKQYCALFESHEGELAIYDGEFYANGESGQVLFIVDGVASIYGGKYLATEKDCDLLYTKSGRLEVYGGEFKLTGDNGSVISGGNFGYPSEILIEGGRFIVDAENSDVLCNINPECSVTLRGGTFSAGKGADQKNNTVIRVREGAFVSEMFEEDYWLYKEGTTRIIGDLDVEMVYENCTVRNRKEVDAERFRNDGERIFDRPETLPSETQVMEDGSFVETTVTINRETGAVVTVKKYKDAKGILTRMTVSTEGGKPTVKTDGAEICIDIDGDAKALSSAIMAAKGLTGEDLVSEDLNGKDLTGEDPTGLVGNTDPGQQVKQSQKVEFRLPSGAVIPCLEGPDQRDVKVNIRISGFEGLNLEPEILISRDILEAARIAGKKLTVILTDDTGKVWKTWEFDGAAEGSEEVKEDRRFPF